MSERRRGATVAAGRGAMAIALLCGAAAAKGQSTLAAEPAATAEPVPAPVAEPASASASASAAASAGAPTSGPAWRLDPTHTFVHWEVLHMGTSTIRGRFDRVGGNVDFDARAKRIDIGITVDTGSVSTAVAPLDSLLRGAQLLSAAAYPQAYFTARGARWEGDEPREIRGEFTLRGVSQGLTLKALRWHCGLNPVFRREVCGGDFEGEIVRSSFGITHSRPLVADKVRVLVQVEAIRQ